MEIRPVNYKLYHSYARLKNFVSKNYNVGAKENTLGCDIFVTNKNNSSVSFSKNTNDSEPFELNLCPKELELRTNKDNLITVEMLNEDSPEYDNLSLGDKEALKHLVIAAKYADKIFMKQDNPLNIPFYEYLQEQSENGNENAKRTLQLFNAQKGIISPDFKANKVVLLKDAQELPGKGFYPSDLSKEEFHIILKSMLESGEQEEVKKILSQRTVVKRDGNKLKAVDYTEEYSEEFSKIANELEKAAKTSTNKDFNEYLLMQAQALKENDYILDAWADKKWAELQDTPLEFTISRESYADELTGTVYEDKELNKMLILNNIQPFPKDSIGIRVGIVNKKGTDELLKIKKYIPLMAENMPLKDNYKQNISSSEDNKQTMVDVDIVILSGDEGAYRAGLVIAQNLPNNDKMSLKIGGGRRNVYHRQVRMKNSQAEKAKTQEKLNVILNPDLHKYYNTEADHWFTIGHENAHSLGPSSGTDLLGQYKDIIEENKADMAALAFLKILTEKGVYTEEQKNQILTTYAVNNFLKAKPHLSQAHRVRSVMQNFYFIKEGAIMVDNNGVIDVNLDKMIPTANKMLKEIIEVQLSKDINCAKEYINNYFYWTDEMDRVAKNLNKTDKTLNGIIISPLADYLIKNSHS